jgi:two-component system, cell cycle sensor histidine kinase and response regulator CckA
MAASPHCLGMATVLVVEDNPLVARTLALMVEHCNFTALLATNIEDGVALARTHAADLVMILCDVVLPLHPGPVVAARLRAICPDVKICYTSGYTLDLLEQQGLLRQAHLNDPAVAYLQKPFLPACLRDVLTAAVAPKGARAACAYAAAA